MVPTVSRPLLPEPIARAASKPSLASSSASLARWKSAWPASVISMPRAALRNSGVPTAASRFLMWTDSGGWAMLSRRAALPTLRSSATATK